MPVSTSATLRFALSRSVLLLCCIAFDPLWVQCASHRSIPSGCILAVPIPVGIASKMTEQNPPSLNVFGVVFQQRVRNTGTVRPSSSISSVIGNPNISNPPCSPRSGTRPRCRGGFRKK